MVKNTVRNKNRSSSAKQNKTPNQKCPQTFPLNPRGPKKEEAEVRTFLPPFYFLVFHMNTSHSLCLC